MTHLDCIRNKPWLVICNKNKITDRLLRTTNGQAFVVFNKIQQNYELHTLEAYKLSGDSYNTSVPIEVLNSFVIHDYRINDLATNLNEVMSERLLRERTREKENEENTRDRQLSQQIKIIERVLGTNL